MNNFSSRILLFYSIVILLLLVFIPVVSIYFYEYNQNTKMHERIQSNTKLLKKLLVQKNFKDINNIDRYLDIRAEFLVIIKNKELIYTNKSPYATNEILKTVKYDESIFYTYNNQNNLEHFYKEYIDDEYFARNSVFYDMKRYIFQFAVIEKGHNVYQFYLGLDEHLSEDSLEDVYGERIYRDIILVSIFAFTLLLIYAQMGLKIFTNPIRQILKEINEIKLQKDISLRINEEYENNEFKKIAMNFNSMLNEIEDDIEKIKSLTITDALTQLHNRRHFDAIFEQEFQRCKRAKTNLVLSIFDIDHFKLYNDFYGHQKGDEALQKVSQVIQSCTNRANDFAFRVGGEEFAIVTSGMSKQEVELYFEKIRASIEYEKIEHEKNSAGEYLTASFGVLVVDFKDSSINMSSSHLYKVTDDVLYKAKEDARNNVKVKVLL